MCEYLGDASSNLDCLDDILTLDEDRPISSSNTSRKPHSTPRDDTDNTVTHRDKQQQVRLDGRRSGSAEETERRTADAARRVAGTRAPATSGADGCASNCAAADELSLSARRPDDWLGSSSTSRSPPLSSGETKLFKTDLIHQHTKSGPMSCEDDHLITCMLITANVGTIFEESTLLDLWFKQLKSYLVTVKPQLVAIHCQEVGGKNYETSMRNVSKFTDQILGDQTIIGDYSRVRIFLDENFQCLEKFTALGSLYLIHDSVDNVKLYNFKTAQYDLVEDQNIFAASDEDDLKALVESDGKQKTSLSQTTLTTTTTTITPTTTVPETRKHQNYGLAEHVEKVKFPPELFPECRWSRKGFMRTRWMFNECQPLDLVNIHLFHDASNLIAMKATPSPYAQTRQKALEYTLRRISLPLTGLDTSNNNVAGPIQTPTGQAKEGTPLATCDDIDQVPMFIFGDFNFRLDTNGVIQRITEGVSPVVKKSSDSDEVIEFVYHRKETGDVAAARSECDCGNQMKTSKSNVPDNGNESDTLNMNAASDYGNRREEGGGVVMTIGKKLFDCQNLDEMFRAAKNTEWLLELDNELDSFRNELHEFRIAFSPSYPFKEDETGGHSYMKTRCPSWCDRILFNSAGNRIIYGKNMADDENLDGKKRIEHLQNQGDVIYRLMGNSVPMGDHKPVLLYCRLRLNPSGVSSKFNVRSNAISESASGLQLRSTAT